MADALGLCNISFILDQERFEKRSCAVVLFVPLPLPAVRDQHDGGGTAVPPECTHPFLPREDNPLLPPTLSMCGCECNICWIFGACLGTALIFLRCRLGLDGEIAGPLLQQSFRSNYPTRRVLGCIDKVFAVDESALVVSKF